MTNTFFWKQKSLSNLFGPRILLRAAGRQRGRPRLRHRSPILRRLEHDRRRVPHFLPVQSRQERVHRSVLILRPINVRWDRVNWPTFLLNQFKGIMTVKENCLGNFESFGNHVGDWEHATLRFQVSAPLLESLTCKTKQWAHFWFVAFLFNVKNGRPQTLYLSVHNFGAYYSWNETSGCFQLARSESPKQKVLFH